MGVKVVIFVLSLCIFESIEKKNKIHSRVADENGPIVNIEDGAILGRVDKTVDQNKTYLAFQGIPYAKPPIGDLRFRPPVPNDKWNGTLNATREGSSCVQGILPVTGSEDCLFINVYTTNLTGSRPVMAWIHGGAFLFGNSSYQKFGPDYILDEDIVHVQFNYRLGVFGFLSTMDEACPGNNGLKDQCLALKWVKKNIRHFGGDPDKVTLYGESAGSASVSYQLQSACAKGLFRAAIMESGSSLCLWALTRDPRATAFKIGESLKLNTSDSNLMVEGLRMINATILQQASLILSTGDLVADPLAGLQFSPVIEPHHEGAFFYNYSDLLLSEGQFHRVPTIIGMNSNEGAVAGDIPELLRLYLVNFDLNPSLLAPADLTNSSYKRDIAALLIKYHYFNILPLSFQTDSVIKFISDDQFNRPIRRMVIDMSRYSPVYFYMFSYEGLLGGVEGERSLKGVGHTEELGYIFRSYVNGRVSSSDVTMRKRMIRMWTNFAKYGQPTIERDPLLQNLDWPRAQPRNLVYMDINSRMTIRRNPFESDMRFYDRIYRLYGSPPYNTY
ncbi:unnamed protein product [Phaedon cochleariae]|uniref:Carboxylic ester hydrolase n=1 Tax=Phaedon cochleariae TaxID=80249 RepID=A0A9P0GIQ7_PHACE|nr:unnamed protein product [Phaedon cochleariae]